MRTVLVQGVFAVLLALSVSACGIGLDPFPNRPFRTEAPPSWSGSLFFAGSDAAGSDQLYRVSGGRIHKIEIPGPAQKEIANLTAFRGSLYFTAVFQRPDENTADYRLYRVSPDGMVMVLDLPLFSMAPFPYLRAIQGKLYFPAQNSAGGLRLFSWDGSGAPAALPSGNDNVVDGQTKGDEPLDPVLFQGRLVYAAMNHLENPALDEILVVDLETGGYFALVNSSSPRPDKIFAVAGNALFINDGVGGRGVLRWDGAESPSPFAQTMGFTNFLPFGAGVVFASSEASPPRLHYWAAAASSTPTPFTDQGRALGDAISWDDPMLTRFGDYIFSRCDTDFGVGLCRTRGGNTVVTEVGKTAISELKVHAGKLCFSAQEMTGDIQNKVYCISDTDEEALPLSNTFRGGSDEPVGLTSTPEGLFFSSQVSQGEELPRKLFLSRDLVTVEQVPSDEPVEVSLSAAPFYFP
jgi:hypothetical protein